MLNAYVLKSVTISNPVHEFEQNKFCDSMR